MLKVQFQDRPRLPPKACHRVANWSNSKPEASSLHLDFLDLSNNRLTHIPSGLEQWSIDHLVLNNNDLSHVDFSLGFSSLRHLELSQNPIQKIAFSPIHEQQVQTLKCALDTAELSDRTYALYKENFQSLRGLQTLDFGFVQKIERQWMTDSLSRAQGSRHPPEKPHADMRALGAPPRSRACTGPRGRHVCSPCTQRARAGRCMPPGAAEGAGCAGGCGSSQAWAVATFPAQASRHVRSSSM